MIPRPLWSARLQEAWRQAPVAWLAGVRRVGKTVLARSLEGTTFLNCDRPSSAERLADPESFFRTVRTKVVVLDEVQQLPDPSRVLKIAAAMRWTRSSASGSRTRSRRGD
jgi:predicted AAA+ superfamily ATPase